MDESKLVQLRRKKGESEEDFKTRFELSEDDYNAWTKATREGATHSGPSPEA